MAKPATRKSHRTPARVSEKPVRTARIGILGSGFSGLGMAIRLLEEGIDDFQVLSGGLLLGAFFLATDYVTTPITRWGRVIFGLGAGLLTIVIRLYGSLPEGVCFSILIMNAFAPMIDSYVRPRPYGLKRVKEVA